MMKLNTLFLPKQLCLRAVSEVWTIRYAKISQRKVILQTIVPQTLLIQSPRFSKKYILGAIKLWLKKKAYLHFSQQLQTFSHQFDLPYKKLTVRGQRARWGSCTEDKSLSLNYKLLFIPKPLADYILLHELCHTRHFNHSKHFWALVEKHDPQHEEKQKALLKAYRYLPRHLG
jgi:hypothetical protein